MKSNLKYIQVSRAMKISPSEMNIKQTEHFSGMTKIITLNIKSSLKDSIGIKTSNLIIINLSICKTCRQVIYLIGA